MSNELELVLVIALGEVLPAIVFLYAAYWSFEIRRALVGRIYRRQAAWLGILAINLAAVVFITYSTNIEVEYLISLYYAVLFLVVFAYIDSVIPVARRSDPLLRGILHWGTLRYFLWFDAFLLGVLNVGIPGVIPPSFASGSSLVANLSWFVVASILFGFSGVAVYIGARRSRDMVLRSSLKWLGAILLITLATFVVDTTESLLIPTMTNFQFFYTYDALPSGVLYILMAYSFYRSARALSSLGRIQDES